jgi:type VI secretion system protein ImpH
MAMAATGRESHSRLIDRLLAKPEAFEVFTAVQCIEEEAARVAREAEASLPPEVGSQDRGAGVRDPVRLVAAVTLGFPGGAITSAHRHSHDSSEQDMIGPVELSLACFGLIGPAGVLPHHYTALVQERVRRFRDRTLRNFLDLFNHRAASLLVRAWGKYRPAAQRSRLTVRGQGASWDEAPTPRDPLTATLASLLGLGNRTLADRMRGSDQQLLYYAGTLSRRVPAALPLENLISDRWGVPAVIAQFVGRWLTLASADQTRLSAGRFNQQLGVDAIAGSRVWSVESAFCIRLGPLSLSEFRRWLPGGTQLGELSDLVRFHVGPALEATVRPILSATEVPPCRLGGNPLTSDGTPAGSRLGWTTWLVSRPPTADREDAAFDINP